MPEIRDQITAAAEAAQFGSSKTSSRDGTPMTENGDNKPKPEDGVIPEIELASPEKKFRGSKKLLFWIKSLKKAECQKKKARLAEK